MLLAFSVAHLHFQMSRWDACVSGGGKRLKDDQNVDQCSLEVPLREELKREKFEKRVKYNIHKS